MNLSSSECNQWVYLSKYPEWCVHVQEHYLFLRLVIGVLFFFTTNSFQIYWGRGFGLASSWTLVAYFCESGRCELYVQLHYRPEKWSRKMLYHRPQIFIYHGNILFCIDIYSHQRHNFSRYHDMWCTSLKLNCVLLVGKCNQTLILSFCLTYITIDFIPVCIHVLRRLPL